MVLHTLVAAPDTPAFNDCLVAAGAGDTIVLMGDGVYAALPGSAALARLLEHPAQVCVLGSDAQALGVKPPVSAFTVIDMAAVVTLTETHPRQLAWY